MDPELDRLTNHVRGDSSAGPTTEAKAATA